MLQCQVLVYSACMNAPSVSCVTVPVPLALLSTGILNPGASWSSSHDHNSVLLHQALAQEVAHYLGMELGSVRIRRFADQEIYVQVQVSNTLSTSILPAFP